MTKLAWALRYLGCVLVLLTMGAPLAAAHELTADQLRTVRFDQQPGASVPFDLQFRDETGHSVRLGQYFGERPVILTLNYFHCQNLCPIELDGLIQGLNGVSFGLGQEFTLVTLSIDSRDGPAEASDAKARALRGYDKPQSSAGWHVLTGDQSDIEALTQAIGFRYIYDPIEDEFAHPAGVVVLTPQGRISRYLYGLDFSATDLRLALVEAAAQHIGSIVDRALLICYHYDPLTGRYTPLAVNTLRGAAVAGVFGLLGLLSWLWLPELRAKFRRST